MKKIVSLIFLMASFGLYAQQEASNWYFGENAGISFDIAAGTVTAVSGGALNTREGCSSISDANGNLLFYSDGTTVFNRNHSIMLNGMGLFGDASSTQSAIIVSKPQDPNIYYIFTVDVEVNIPPMTSDPPSRGLNYSEIDMTLDGGLGGVTIKNVNLLAKSSEKVSAVLKDCVTKSLWVISFADPTGAIDTRFDTYHAFEVTATGVNNTAVTSTFPISITDQRGYLKFSPDGTKMASANMSGSGSNGIIANNGLLLYDFDVTTGIVSNQQELNINNSSAIHPYGIEFSPSNELLYVHSHIANGTFNNFSSLVQFDLMAPDVQASQFLLDDRQLYRGALQLGPNGKIYRALSTTYNLGQPYLGVINNPNVRGIGANYQHDAVFLGLNNSAQGLPPFDQSLFNTQIDIIQNGISTVNLDLCTGDTYTLIAPDIPGATYNWTLDGNPLPESDFDLVLSGAGHYQVIVVQDPLECRDNLEGQAFVNYFDTPTATQIDPINICDDDNDRLWDFDLTLNDGVILNGQDPTIYEVKYFKSQTDADSNIDEIVGLHENESNPQEIFVSVQNRSNPNCNDTSTSFFIDVFNSPTANPIEDITICDDDDSNGTDGENTINLGLLIPTVSGGQDVTDFPVTFHLNQGDANTGDNPLPLLYNNITPQQTIFFRIENSSYTECAATDFFVYTVNPIPIAINDRLTQCDQDLIVDGFTVFNLTESHDTITGGNPELITTFHPSFLDAQNETLGINGDSYPNTGNPETIYVRVEHMDTGCHTVVELILDVSLTNIANDELTKCDDDGDEDGFYDFDLSEATDNVLMNAPPGVTLAYYATQNDALLEENPIGPIYRNTVEDSQIVYARAENANACYGISEVQLTLNKLPDIEIEDEAVYCLNTFPDTIALDAGLNAGTPSDYSYLWSNGEITHEIQIDAPGDYTVTVTNNMTTCSKDRIITVLPSNTATFADIEVTDVSSNNTVTVLVSGEGDYEFSLDSQFGPYQDSNFFENVAAGLHTVYVRDRNNCGTVNQIVSVIGFPKYLTPNSDGVHDTWQVYGITAQFQPNTKILIHDRYGKLLKQLDPLGDGWDGTFNGKLLPSSDYWFAITLQDGRVFKSHFTLKR